MLRKEITLISEILFSKYTFRSAYLLIYKLKLIEMGEQFELRLYKIPAQLRQMCNVNILFIRISIFRRL